MTIRPAHATGSENPATRLLTCAQCGGHFECALDGTCWCAHEPVRLPMPTAGSDCLCPGCLREAARSQDSIKSATDV